MTIDNLTKVYDEMDTLKDVILPKQGMLIATFRKAIAERSADNTQKVLDTIGVFDELQIGLDRYKELTEQIQAVIPHLRTDPDIPNKQVRALFRRGAHVLEAQIHMYSNLSVIRALYDTFKRGGPAPSLH